MRAVVLALVLLAAPAPSGPRYAVRPIGERANFVFAVGAGGSMNDSLVVTNVADAPLRVRLYGADLINLPGGGIAPRQEADHQGGVGAWLRVDRTDLVVAPHSEETVGFSMAVPAGTGPGDYGGAVVAAEVGSTPSGAVQLQTRLALQVRVRVPGVVQLAGRLGPLHVDKRTARTQRFRVTLTNEGNVSLRFNGRLDVRRHGKVVAHAVLRPSDAPLLPAGKVELTGTWFGRPVWGSADVRAGGVALSPDGSDLVLTGAARRVSYIPWLLIVLALLALALAVAIVWRLRRVPERAGDQLGVVGEETARREAA